jgi:serine/threonine protein kinase
MDFHVGHTFGDYSITALLGADGTEQVYKVEHCLTKRTEAMKVLSAELATETQIKRFEREMRVLARLSHPNIAALHNALHAEKHLIIFIEFIEGRTLENMLSAGRLPIEVGVGYIRQILSALRYAHQQSVVHRDVTPANVIVTADGEVKLTDFGLSKSFGDPLLTNCGEILGSVAYLAPEQLKGATQPDRRSDLYSVGAILYEHLTGQKPFGADRRLAPVLTDSEAEPQPPSQLDSALATQWDQITRRALDRNPEHRYQSAQEFLDAIADVIAQSDEAPVQDLPLLQRRTMGIGVAIFAGLVLALAASPALRSLRPAAPVIAPLQPLHIPPPDFAISIAPPPPAQPTKAPRHTRAIPKPPSVTAQSAVSDTPQASAQTKKNFWSKLNVFKKKKSDDSNEKP